MKDRSTIYAYLLGFAFIAGTVWLWMNGIDPRIQRFYHFTLAMTVCASVFVFLSVDWLIGLLALFASYKLFMSDARTTEYIIFALLAFYAAWSAIEKNEKDRGIMLDLIIIVALVNFAFQLLNIQGVQAWPMPIYSPSASLAPGLMGNHGETSCMYGMALPAFFRPRRWFLAPIAIIGIVLAKEWVAVAAIISMILMWYAMNIKKLTRAGHVLLISIVLSTAFLFMAVKPLNVQSFKTERLRMWRISAVFALMKPVTGWGFGQYENVIPFITQLKYLSEEQRAKVYKEIHDIVALHSGAKAVGKSNPNFFNDENQNLGGFGQAHNEYVEWWFIGGLLGLLMLVSIAARKLYLAFRAEPIAAYGLLASCVCAFFWFTWHLMPLILITVVYLGMVPKRGALDYAYK